MDKKKGIINISTSIFFKVLLLVANILVRRFLIRYIGNEINGLNSLYVSILDFLSVAELGVGSAITFCMYKPIVEGCTQKVSALYRLFTKMYLIIGSIILVCGCLVMPILPFIAKDYQSIDVNLYLTFGLMLISVVLSYMFSSKTSLINAYKNNYVTTIISSSGQLIQIAMQIAVIITVRSFTLFLVCRIVAMALQWGVTEIIVNSKYKFIVTNKQKIDFDTRKEVTQNIKAMFMHKIGGILVNTTDSLIISAFVGIVILGKYSNYTTVVLAMFGILQLLFTALTSVIGHMCVKEDTEQVKKYFNFFHTANFVIGLIFFLGYYATIDNLIAILFADGLQLSRSISFVITMNYFVQFMRQATLLFRDATGTFYNDRWKPLFEGILNIILSISFVFLFRFLWGEEFAVVGVIAATIISNIFICHIVEPHVLYKYALKTTAKKYYIRNYCYIVIFTAVLIAMHFCMISNENKWVELFANGGISLAFSLSLSAIIIFCNKEFRYYLRHFADKFKRRKEIPSSSTAAQDDLKGDKK